LESGKTNGTEPKEQLKPYSSEAIFSILYVQTSKNNDICNTDYWLGFHIPLITKQVISETFPKTISWLGMEKQNLTQQKQTFINQKKCTATQNKQKLKPGLVTCYDIRPQTERAYSGFGAS